MIFQLRSFVLVFASIILGSCDHKPVPSSAYDHDIALTILEQLSSDDLRGRAPETVQSKVARDLITDRLEALKIAPLGDTYAHPFIFGDFSDGVPSKSGVNLYAFIKGAEAREDTIVVTAHYDHLGVVDGEIYNGADDNASGVVGLLALGEYFSTNPPKHNLLLAFLDAEEQGFGGAIAFMDAPPLPLEDIKLNLNLDMISRGDNGLLWASGTSHWPGLIPLVQNMAATAPVTVKMGFDQGEDRQDWTLLSDHAVFFRAGIPHLYLGVEDHIDYHKPSDDFEKVDPAWFLNSVQTVILMAKELDRANLSALTPQSASIKIE